MRYLIQLKSTTIILILCTLSLSEVSIPGGNVSGTWTAAESPYLIGGDVTIPNGQTLIIEPNVDILFEGWYNLTINGILDAIGEADMPIVFTPADTSYGWTGLRFIDAPDSSHLNYCILEFGQATGADPLNRGGALYIKNSNPVITNSTIRKSRAADYGGAIYMENANPLFNNCTVTGNYVGTDPVGYGGGIYCMDSSPIFRHSYINKNHLGVSGGFSTGRGSGGGIYLENSDAVFEDNIISNNRIGGSGNTGSWARGAAIYATSSDPAFINNTITGNVADLNVIADEQGGIIYISGSNPLFVNNILWDNTPQDIYIAQNAIAASVMLAYTDIQNGQSAVNYGDNGTLYWQEGNINRDPLFLDASHGNYNLTSGSTCIDSGTAYYEWDGQVLINLQSDKYVGSAPDMGALEYNSDEKFNQPPSAIIHSNKTEGSAPLTVSFDASASYDNDGNLNSYYWDFDDGGTSTAIKPEHTFSDSGTYYVRLTVTDDDGAYDREVFKIYAHGGTSIPEGSISGVWQISGSPYYIEGDVTVPAGESLTINAGVEIIFKSWYHFMVNGLLQVNGTHDMPVMFKPQDSTLSWRGMRIMNASDDCYLNWCTMEFAHAVGEAPLDRGGALYVNNTDIMIENCTFQKNEADDHGGGLYLENSNVLIDGCIIRDNYSGTGTTCYGGGISCINSNPVIRNSEISNNSVGVSGGFSTGRGSGGGIYLGNSDAVLEYNIISNNRIGGSGNTGSWARGAAIYATSSDPVLINNTITGNVADLNIIADEQGGIMYVSGSNPKFVNNILWNNTPQDIYIVQNAIAASVIVAYTDIQNGQSAVNYGDNGTLYWQEGNIDQNPWFLDASNQDYNLIAGSPCIDKGTAYYEWDDQVLVDLNSGQYNGSAPDMGAVESGTVSGIDDAGYAVNNFEMLQNYPNPFNPTTTIKFTLPKAGWVNTAVFNTLGEKIMTLIDRPMTSGIYQVDFDGTDLSSGIYYYAIKAGDFHQVKKMMLLK